MVCLRLFVVMNLVMLMVGLCWCLLFSWFCMCWVILVLLMFCLLMEVILFFEVSDVVLKLFFFLYSVMIKVIRISVKMLRLSGDFEKWWKKLSMI